MGPRTARCHCQLVELLRNCQRDANGQGCVFHLDLHVSTAVLLDSRCIRKWVCLELASALTESGA